MKITNVTNNIKRNFGILAIVSTPLLFIPQHPKAQVLEKTPAADVYDKRDTVPPKGTTSRTVLLGAPSADITIAGEDKTAKIVVDLAKNVLYTYDDSGKADCAYLIASGKPRYPTDTGVRVVTHVETYPYKNAPAATRRHRKPNDYGPKIICLEKIDPDTGSRSSTGEFIHGTNNPSSIGKYASLGCMRMDNEVIKELAKIVKRGDIVIIKR